jgi:hypothetical protein
MCHFQCPLDIDIPRLVAAVRSRELGKGPRRLGSMMVNDPWLLMSTTAHVAPVANLVLENPWARILMERSIGLQRDAWVPHPRRKTFDQWVRSKKREKGGA